MMNHSLLYQYNPWWEETFSLKDVIHRPQIEKRLEDLIDNRSVIFMTGLRRVGKTTLMKLLVQTLISQGVPPQHIFYVSLDDYLLTEVSIIDILTEYRKLHRLPMTTKIYAFFDEVTAKKDFRVQFKNIYDQHHVKLFASSSSSSALRDKKGFLTGRERIVEVPPLSFDEFLMFKGIAVKQRDAHLQEGYFEDYLQTGGIPEYVLKGDREYLTALVDDILYKDIIAFHGLKNSYLIKDFFMLLMERAGKQVSVNKLAKILGISPDTARRYLHMFEESYLIFLVPRFGKTNETILSQKKIYAADMGIRNLFTGFRDKGALFENLVFLMIKGLNPRYILQDETEIDFITENKALIEVKYGQEMNEKQSKLFNELKANKKLIINGFRDLHKLDALREQ